MLVLRLLYLRKRAKEGRLYHRLDADQEGLKDRELLLRSQLEAIEDEDYESQLMGVEVPLLSEVRFAGVSVFVCYYKL